RGDHPAQQGSQATAAGDDRRLTVHFFRTIFAYAIPRGVNMKLDEHPTVRHFHENAGKHPAPPTILDAAWLRQLCLDCGANDAGLVEISRPALDNQRDDILRVFPPTKTLLSFVCRMNREPIRSPARSVANLEFHHTGDHVNEVARKVVATLEN